MIDQWRARLTTYVEVICIDVNVSAKFVNVACKMTRSVLQVSKYWQLSSVKTLAAVV